ncbi:hypothetical protein M0811_09681 [Anaeramoeba ignava]|uniref:Uncharacterized protein n=1 Tax=Anaeramoeba ignava TaxID=1746090 RepID=A0A9Q0LFS7_ANAIG|nr:hypothetical protein M0811_09681 [Anaeramoeba ignava]
MSKLSQVLSKLKQKKKLPLIPKYLTKIKDIAHFEKNSENGEALQKLWNKREKINSQKWFKSFGQLVLESYSDWNPQNNYQRVKLKKKKYREQILKQNLGHPISFLCQISETLTLLYKTLEQYLNLEENDPNFLHNLQNSQFYANIILKLISILSRSTFNRDVFLELPIFPTLTEISRLLLFDLEKTVLNKMNTNSLSTENRILVSYFIISEVNEIISIFLNHEFLKSKNKSISKILDSDLVNILLGFFYYSIKIHNPQNSLHNSLALSLIHIFNEFSQKNLLNFWQRISVFKIVLEKFPKKKRNRNKIKKQESTLQNQIENQIKMSLQNENENENNENNENQNQNENQNENENAK